jgi:ADP-ribosylglycohydrolase
MLGAIAGDMIGSPYEFDRNHIKTTDFPLFSERSRYTDDTVLTIATAQVLLDGCTFEDYASAYVAAYNDYPRAGYGGIFRQSAAAGGGAAYGSYGNGSAMRVSPVGWAFATLEETLAEAKRSAEVTHNHPEGIKAAQAVAAAIFLARTGAGKEEIRDTLTREFGYDLRRSLDEIRPTYRFTAAAAYSVPEAIIAFLESENFEDAVRNAVSLGGDSDTQACIAGAIAEAFYGGVPKAIQKEMEKRLDPGQMLVITLFRAQKGVTENLPASDYEEDEAPAVSREDIDALLDYLPLIQAPDFTPGRMEGGEQRPDGAFTMPYYVMSEDAAALVRALAGAGFVFPYDWPGWMQAKGRELMNPQGIASAYLPDLQRLVTAVVRQDRFVEGAIGSAFEHGFFVRVLKRLKELREEMD